MNGILNQMYGEVDCDGCGVDLKSLKGIPVRRAGKWFCGHECANKACGLSAFEPKNYDTETALIRNDALEIAARTIENVAIGRDHRIESALKFAAQRVRDLKGNSP